KLVSTGEAALGIVYTTDAVAEPGVKVIGTFPEDSHPPIVYPVGELAGSKSADAAAFVKYLQTPKAQELFKAQGFTYLAATNGGKSAELREWPGLGPDEWNAVRPPIKVAPWAMVASLPPGVLTALLLARGRFWGKPVLNGIVHLPLVLPPVVTGYLLLLGF